MLYDYFSLCQYIIEDLKISTCIINVNSYINTHSDRIYKTEGSSNDNNDKDSSYKTEGSSNDKSDKDSNYNKDDDREEESFEIEEEINEIEKLMRLSNDAMILDEKLPDSQKDKNSHLNALRENPHIKEFFEGKTPNVKDLPELNKSLKEAREDKIKELSEVKNYANNESSTNSLRDSSYLSLHESNNTLNKD